MVKMKLAGIVLTVWVTGVFFVGCGRMYKRSASADFILLQDVTSGTGNYPQRTSDEPTKKEHVIITDNCEIVNSGRHPGLFFHQDGGYIEFSPGSVNLPSDWQGFTHVQFQVSNPGSGPVSLVFSLKGSRGVIHDSTVVSPGKKLKVVLDLTDLPLTAGNNSPYQPQFIRIAGSPGGAEIQVFSAKLKNSFGVGKVPVVDQFGQRKSKNWKGKISAADQLENNRIDEAGELKKEWNPGMDKYRGWTNGPQLEGTGFFRVAQHEGKYWFVTPSGRLFWSFGVTGIRPKVKNEGSTKITGREFLFEKVPPVSGPESFAWTTPEDASFYCWNILRKYGDLDEWRSTALTRLDAWGYNTIGNWSEDSLVYRSHIPFTWSFRTTNRIDLMLKNGIADVFNPHWMNHIDSVFSDALKFRDNPFLIGYFVDNEAGWGNLNLLERMNDDSWTRKKWLEIIQQKYLSVEQVNSEWETSFKDWNDVIKLNVPLDQPVFRKDLLEFEQRFARQYFQTIRNTLYKYDSNHLYLGCRFTRKLIPEHICSIAGENCDVITVNVYAWAPTEEVMGEWFRRTGKPVLIGEHHINLASDRQVPALWGATPPEERRQYYKNYVETWAKIPWSLGCHWYQFTDQDITGRVSNGENQPVGLVDITDQPHRELTETAKMLSTEIYRLHANHQPAGMSVADHK